GVSRTQQRFAPSLPQISDGLVPNLTLDSVMGAPLDLGAQGIWGEPLERLEDSPVQLATSILRKAFIRDLVGERVLEGVLEVWRDSRLVKKLHRLKLVEAAPQGIVALIGHRAQQRELNFLANHRGALDQISHVGFESVEARPEHALDRVRNSDRA